MDPVFATAFGLPYDTVLLVTTLVAAAATAVAMLAIVFFAWAPYVSGDWATQFGVVIGEDDDEDAASTQ